VRALLVAENLPWPAPGGGLIRLARAIEAVASVAELDLFACVDPRRSDVAVPPEVPLHRWTAVPYPQAPHPLRWRTSWLAHGDLPLDVSMLQSDATPRRALAEWAVPPYDVVWVSTAAMYEWVGRPSLGPTIVDLMDLEDVKASQRAELLAASGGALPPLADFRRRVAVWQARRNARGWSRLQRLVAERVERVVLCTELDVARSGLPGAVAVPNTYPRPAEPAGSGRPTRPPVVLLQGSLHYPPNMDAARWLVEEIVPRLRRRIGELEVRLVGTASTGVKLLHDPPTVHVVGRVPAIEPELARASVAVVPVRYGSGTRVKILESFAHRVPVVSTTLGAEGLDVCDGEHLLLADDPDEFASAVCRVLGDDRLRTRLVEAAEERYTERYRPSAAEERIRRLVRDVARASTRS
jgi:glycosyltransferase involved in cell wall biosynthesis